MNQQDAIVIFKKNNLEDEKAHENCQQNSGFSNIETLEIFLENDPVSNIFNT